MMANEGAPEAYEERDEETVVDENDRIGDGLAGFLPVKSIDTRSPLSERNEDDWLYLAMRLADGLCYGISKEDPSWVRLFSGDYCIRVNLVTRLMQERSGNGWKETPFDEGLIDLDVNGKRWEGGVREGRSYGYGILYDEEGRREYEGFMIDNRRYCYGTEYYSDISRIKYIGCYYNGKRFGKGVLYDRNGAVEHDGLWKAGRPYSPEFDGITVENWTETIALSDASFREVESFILPPFLVVLRRMDIGNDCFGNTRSLKLTGLVQLESVRVGKRSFTHATTEKEMFTEKSSNGALEIANCPHLKSIEIGDFSFADYHLLELENLPSLQHIVFGEHCFHWTYRFSLSGHASRVLISRTPRVTLSSYC